VEWRSESTIEEEMCKREKKKEGSRESKRRSKYVS
jgi:hypothetical protein